MKVGFVYGWHSSNAAALEQELARLREQGLNIRGVDVAPILQYSMSPSDLDFQYCLRNPTVLGGLARLRQACAEFDVVVIYGTLQIHPDFIRTSWKDKFTIYWATDDPVSSVVHTLPYVGICNHIFCQTPRYLDGIQMPEWLRSMGAREASYLPLGYFPAWMRGRSPEEILAQPRDIEISFVGSPSWRKEMLLGAKRRFGKRLQIYSRDWSPIRHVPYDLIKGGVFHIVRPAADESDVYFRSVLSINSNACSGPSTSRTFHIPICGAVQLCDFPDGLADIFELGTHVVPYEFLSCDSLCAAVAGLFDDPRRVAAIRAAGFWHVHQNYRFGDLLRNRLNELGRG